MAACTASRGGRRPRLASWSAALQLLLAPRAVPLVSGGKPETPPPTGPAFAELTALVVASGGLEAEVAQFDALLSRNGRAASPARRLVVVSAYGRVSATPVVRANLASHFADGSAWERVVFAYANGEVLRDALDADARLVRAGGGVGIFQASGRLWGEFLHYLRPAVVSRYEHILLLLDDLLIPRSGALRVSVPRLLHSMRAVGASLISPAINGGEPLYPAMRDVTKGRCVRRIPSIEWHATLFERRAWTCLASLLDRANVGGCGYTPCFAKYCAECVAAIDDTQAGYHLERAVPDARALRSMEPDERALVRAFAGNASARKAKGGAAPSRVGKVRPNPCMEEGSAGLDMWRRYNCTPGPVLMRVDAIPEERLRLACRAPRAAARATEAGRG